MKKVLIFSLAYYPKFTSGAEAAVKEITHRISSEDIEFHMLTVRFDMQDPAYEKVDNVHVHRVGFGNHYISKIFFIPLSAVQGILLHKKHHFNALWAMMTYMLFPVALMRLLGTRIPHVLTLQDGDPYEKVFKRWFIRPLTPLLDYGFRTATKIQVISHYLGTWPEKRGYTGDVELIYNGANPKNLFPEYSEEEALAVRDSLGKKEGDIYMLNAARLVHQKGHDTVIRALPLLPDHVHFILIGSGEDEAMLKNLAKELNVENRVQFLGQMDRDKVPTYRNRTVVDIFIGPSRSEGLGNSFLSAMAARLPVIATQEGGIAEFLFDEKRNPDTPPTGWAVDKEHSEQIAEAVQDILAHPEKVKEVTERSYEMVLEKYNWDNIALQMNREIFDQVM
ncbi:hypothetical protein COU15_01400 [Candidatus Kaiserbacteria bacterium CG10_big_fil_rev_8_21_14_0_10_45_20]|uniref:Glycosyl transferase family 1 domain-containing protein n=1 Tax=Candidatus Kaiserbacteria bacterium CG10_big_fil_rev_8_21_14_0_10_45_20 TaxID=1974607 RepID=A0A2H0UFX8_9BACT|nr:MAG: hypothetical protein COU15_01400 [Candidatus Kaiserbacteria bacterium CG10_big_fil_rev_8_21_14_0_10_45_20]